ncbi:hypothetical protein PLESTM_000956300 [Pleodorina starrii]|nr:hypothetical protein PLESTM_000956300 [Pleodorina starrii]
MTAAFEAAATARIPFALAFATRPIDVAPEEEVAEAVFHQAFIRRTAVAPGLAPRLTTSSAWRKWSTWSETTRDCSAAARTTRRASTPPPLPA